jgi:ubiquinone/menaquinone biosynthesis C-methylase UbiE
MTPRFIARQLARPSGLPGWLIGHLMNRRNVKMNAFAIRQLAINPTDRVLEVGFGGGATLSHLIKNAGFVAGLDRSRDVIRRANSKFSQAVAAGRAAFHESTVEVLPFDASSFEKAITVNTVYFWESLDLGFRELYRVLAPGGAMVVGFLPKDWMDRMGMPTDIFTTRTLEEVVTATEEAGFIDARIEKPQTDTAWVVIAAFRP